MAKLPSRPSGTDRRSDRTRDVRSREVPDGALVTRYNVQLCQSLLRGFLLLEASGFTEKGVGRPWGAEGAQGACSHPLCAMHRCPGTAVTRPSPRRSHFHECQQRKVADRGLASASPVSRRGAEVTQTAKTRPHSRRTHTRPPRGAPEPGRPGRPSKDSDSNGCVGRSPAP